MAQAKTWEGGGCGRQRGVGELRVQRLSGRTGEVARFCAALPGPVRVSYEAGPTGYGLARSSEPESTS